MSKNRFAHPRVRLTLVCAGAMTLATLGFGVASAKAAPTLVDDPMPAPAPQGIAAPQGTPAVPEASAGLGASAAPGVSAPLGTSGLPGTSALPGVSTPLGASALPGVSSPLGLPGSAVGGSSAGVNAANSFLQALNGMLNRVVPGVGSIMPTDVSALTPPGSTMSGTPALQTPVAPATPPALVPQTLAGARTFH